MILNASIWIFSMLLVFFLVSPGCQTGTASSRMDMDRISFSKTSYSSCLERLNFLSLLKIQCLWCALLQIWAVFLWHFKLLLTITPNSFSFCFIQKFQFRGKVTFSGLRERYNLCFFFVYDNLIDLCRKLIFWCTGFKRSLSVQRVQVPKTDSIVWQWLQGVREMVGKWMTHFNCHHHTAMV